jgi:hypothetical protein
MEATDWRDRLSEKRKAVDAILEVLASYKVASCELQSLLDAVLTDYELAFSAVRLQQKHSACLDQ